MDSECDRDLLPVAISYHEHNSHLQKTRNKLRYDKPNRSSLKSVILSSNDIWRPDAQNGITICFQQVLKDLQNGQFSRPSFIEMNAGNIKARSYTSASL